MTRTQLLCLKHPVKVVVFQRLFKQIAAVTVHQVNVRCA